MSFKSGERAFYPSHGLVEVIGEQSCVLAGKPVACYRLKIILSGAYVIVPVSGCQKVGMRRLIDETNLPEIYEVLKKEPSLRKGVWNKRQREFMQLLRDGHLPDIAALYRDLFFLKNKKELSYGEKRIFSVAEEFLASEISFVLQKEVESVRDHLKSFC